MLHIFENTLLGLNCKYYFRNLLIASLFAGLVWYLTQYAGSHSTAGEIPDMYIIMNNIYLILSTFLYPYAKYTYDSLWEFIFNDSVWAFGGLLLLIVLYFKLIIRTVLFVFAILLAPIGWLMLYFANR